MPEQSIEQLLEQLVQSPENRCFVCSPGNPIGLHLRFQRSGDEVRTQFIPTTWHEGWQGVIHGGILAALLDECMAYTLFFQGYKGVTARMQVRYRGAAYQGDTLEAAAHITRNTSRLVDIAGTIHRGEQLLVEATGRFVKVGKLGPETLG